MHTEREGRPSRGKLIDAFTTSIAEESAPTEKGAGVVLAGRTGAFPSSADLKREAEEAASSNAVFFFPNGDSRLAQSKVTKIDGRPAHTVVRKVEGADGATHHLRLTVVSLDETRSAFLIGIAQDGGATGRDQIDRVLRDAALL